MRSDIERSTYDTEKTDVLGSIVLSMYSVCGLLAYPVLLGIAWYQRAVRRPQNALALKRRLGHVPFAPRPQGRLIWIHGASVGETFSALPLVRALLRQYPSVSCLITARTESGLTLWERLVRAEKEWCGRVQYEFCPTDVAPCVQRFVHHWRPDVCCIVEGDYWPQLLKTLQRNACPVVFASAQMSDTSLKRRLYTRFLWREVFSGVKVCLATSPKQVTAFHTLGVPDTRCVPSLKWSVPQHVCTSDDSAIVQKKLGHARARGYIVLCAVSTHEGEEEIVLQAFEKLTEWGIKSVFILAPRHVQRTQIVEAAAHRYGRTVTRAFESDGPTQAGTVVLVDRMHMMSCFYAFSDVVLVGGSLVRGIGGHNLIEPASFGCAVLHGPYMDKQRVITEEFAKAQAALCMRDAQEIAETMAAWAKKPEQRQAVAQRGAQLARRYAHLVLEAHVQALDPWIR